MALSSYRIPFLIPYFVETQHKSFLDFLNTGLISELSRKNPMKDSLNEFKIIFYPEYYQLSLPEYTPKAAILKFKTYTSKLYIPLVLKNTKTKQSKIQWILLGHLPLMTKRGNFIVNGSPRIIVNQIVRSPGIHYKQVIDEKNRKVYYGDLISQRGAWLRLEIDKKKRVWIQMKRTRKIPVLIFLKALGINDSHLQESLQYLEFLKESKYLTEEIESEDYSHPKSIKDSLLWIYEFVYPEKKRKNKVTLKKAKKFLLRKFFSHRTYDLGYAGRDQLNKKFNLLIPQNVCILTLQDLIASIDSLIKLEKGIGLPDDIDNLKNRRVRTSGELIQNQIGTGFIRLEKLITDKSKDSTLLVVDIFNTKPIDGALREFFGSSPLSQFMDETNPLAELTHKRRISSLGPGGVNRETAGMDVRGIHPSHYGRICPIETPEGRNAGLVNSITTLARINSQGFIETPFYRVYQGQIQKYKKAAFFLAAQEEYITIAPSDLKTDYFNFLPYCSIPVRASTEFKKVIRDKVEYMSVSPIQMISIATSLIPFLEHDDANRALMGSNMQRQAVPLILAEKPIVGTGLEGRIVSDSGHGLQAKSSGLICYVSGNNVAITKFQHNSTLLENKKNLNFFQKKASFMDSSLHSSKACKNKFNYTKSNNLKCLESYSIKKYNNNTTDNFITIDSLIHKKNQEFINFANFKNVTLKSNNQSKLEYKFSLFSKSLFVTPYSFSDFKNRLKQLDINQTEKAGTSKFPKSHFVTNLKNKSNRNNLFLLKKYIKLRETYVTKNFFFNLPLHINIQSSTLSLQNKTKTVYLFNKIVSIQNNVNSNEKINQLFSENVKNFATKFLNECEKLIFSRVVIKKKNVKHLFFYNSLYWQNFKIKKFNKLRYSHKVKSLILNPVAEKLKIQAKEAIWDCDLPSSRAWTDLLLSYYTNHNNLKKRDIKTEIILHVSKVNFLKCVLFKALNKFSFRKNLNFSFLNLKNKSIGSIHDIYTTNLKTFFPKPKINKNTNVQFSFPYQIKKAKKIQRKVDSFINKTLLNSNIKKLNITKIKKNNSKDIFHKNTILDFNIKNLKQTNEKIKITKKANQETKFQFKFFPKIINYSVLPYQHSNQNTCLHQTPLTYEGEWVQKGDLLTDGAASVGGELSLGQSIIVAYMPWEGYNFEDAILVSERLIYDDLYTSIHIERYKIQVSDTQYGLEEITLNIPDIFPHQKLHLDENGIIKIGSWVTQGDILVGKITPIPKRKISGHEKLLAEILGTKKETPSVRDTSLRVPKHVSGRVVHIELIKNENLSLGFSFNKPTCVHIYIAEKRKIQVGDKMSGRHGNKGIISNIVPRQDMPYLADGTPVDMVLNPLGVPSRMNVGQIFECMLGLAGKELNENFQISCFDEMNGPEASRSFTYSKLFEARLKTGKQWLFNPNFPGKMKLFDGRTGECFHQNITVGQPYMLKLVHLVDEKIHARSTGPYSLVTQQPVRGRSKHGGQRLGEMEVWALEGFGAAYTLQELLTTKSDDLKARHQVVQAILQDKSIQLGTPESFKVLLSELQSLCLNIGVYSINDLGIRKKIDIWQLS